MEWIRSGAPCPREVVCDANRALLTAAVRCFTEYLTVEEYSDACKENNLPVCYIRIDVAHFMKTYANFLKNARPRIKTFYLSLLGQLILCRNIHTAEAILKGILIIVRSETEGTTRTNEETMCETYKIKMKNLLISSKEEIPMDDDLLQSDNMNIEKENLYSSNNKWSQWVKDIDHEIQEKISDNEGNRENAHYMPAFADCLLKDIKLIPMWSCICRDKFGYGRIPASSASVESDFNIMKNNFLKTEQIPTRADDFVMKHIKFISGRIKLANVNLQEKGTEDMIEQSTEHNVEIITTDNTINKNIEDECPACRNGDQPSGAHMCYICQKNVHALDSCSAPVGEEGYGQKRICRNCQKTRNVQNIIASREVEDWHGLTTVESQSRGRYLQEKNVENEFLLDKKIHKIPIIRNGGNVNLKAVTFGKKRYSFTNTCAFDSILQLFIAAYFETRQNQRINQY